MIRVIRPLRMMKKKGVRKMMDLKSLTRKKK